MSYPKHPSSQFGGLLAEFPISPSDMSVHYPDMSTPFTNPTCRLCVDVYSSLPISVSYLEWVMSQSLDTKDYILLLNCLAQLH